MRTMKTKIKEQRINWFIILPEAILTIGFFACFIGKIMNSLGFYSDYTFVENYFSFFTVAFVLMLIVNHQFKIRLIEVRE